MTRRRIAPLLATPIAVAGVLLQGITQPAVAGATPVPYQVQTLHFALTVGPSGSTERCDVIGDLYTPDGASAQQPDPAILTTNGFGGSKADQDGLGDLFARRGYIVLSYSGLGFGGSGCRITLDDPDYDGRAASQLVSFLGGQGGIAYADAAHTQPVAGLTDVIHDRHDHAGHADRFDPRVGMVGGSYGGEIQFAAASVDPRIDTIVPLITWNDLSYSLDPNNAVPAGTVTSSTPGAVKLTFGLSLTALGVLSGLQQSQVDPARLIGCPDFASFVCPALITGGALGYFPPSAVAAFRHASVSTYLSSVTIPTLLIQGENDTLFNLNEAIVNYRSLRANHVPVSMIWQSWGHSNSTPAPGEIDLTAPDPSTQYETSRILAWFDHYLKGSPVSTGPRFAYFRNWVDYQGIATPAYATAAGYPVGRQRRLYLSGDGTLTASAAAATTASQRFVTPPAGAPTSLDPVDAIGSSLPPQLGSDDTDIPGTAASWTTPALTAPLTVVGTPGLDVTVTAPTASLTQLAGPGGDLVVFAKLLDVAPDGTATMINGQISPVRIADVTTPVHVTMTGIVHRFGTGHRLRLVIAGGSLNYRGGLVSTPVAVAGGASQTLTLPVTST